MSLVICELALKCDSKGCEHIMPHKLGKYCFEENCLVLEYGSIVSCVEVKTEDDK